MTTEPQDPQPTIEARVLDANELRHIGGRIETVYQAYRDEEEGWIAGLIAVAEDIAPALHDALLLTRAALAASEQRAAAFERDYTAVGERNRELHDQYFALVAEQATTNAAALAATPPRPEPPAALRDLIRQAEVDRDEQSGTAAEEWCGGYLKGLRDAQTALTTPPPAAPSVPDAAGVE